MPDVLRRPTREETLAQLWASPVCRPTPATCGRDWRNIEKFVPNGLLDVMDAWGIERLWDVSIATLGYPPTWAETKPEFDRIKERLTFTTNQQE